MDLDVVETALVEDDGDIEVCVVTAVCYKTQHSRPTVLIWHGV